MLEILLFVVNKFEKISGDLRVEFLFKELLIVWEVILEELRNRVKKFLFFMGVWLR